MPLDALHPEHRGVARRRASTGTAVFLTSTPDRVPHALLHNLKHNKVLHERVVFLTIVTRDIPYVPDEERGEVEPLGCNFYRIERGLRLQGRSRRAGAARGLRAQRLRVRHDGDVVLRVARDADRHRDAGHGAVAREAVRLDVEERDQGVRVLPGARPIASWSWGRRSSCKRAARKQKRRREAGVRQWCESAVTAARPSAQRIVFIALLSIWRIRSADTPYSSASSCSVAASSPRAASAPR